jgi:hypothetical protein
MSAIATCSAHGWPFSFQMTLNARNEGELEKMGLLAGELGAKTASFAMMNATGRPEDRDLYLSPQAWDRIRDRIERLSTLVKVEVTAAEGFRRGDRFHLCEPFRSEVLHVGAAEPLLQPLRGRRRHRGLGRRHVDGEPRGRPPDAALAHPGPGAGSAREDRGLARASRLGRFPMQPLPGAIREAPLGRWRQHGPASERRLRTR